MNPLSAELNQILEHNSPPVLGMLSQVGRQLFFPKGILSQSAQAKEKAHHLNATIGIAREAGHTMYLKSIMEPIGKVRPSESLTYAPSFGLPELRRAWQRALFSKNPSLSGKTISLPVVTCGVTHAVSVFADLWLDPDDVVILPRMMWGNYNMILSVRKGARLSLFDLFDASGGFHIDAFADAVRREAESHAKITVLLNFPHNPTGYAISKEEARAVVDVLVETAASGTRVIAALDDAYFGLFYEERCLQESLFALLANEHPNLLAIKLDGGTKEDFIWGLRIGFISYGTKCRGDASRVYEALEKKTAGDIRGNISNASHLSQTLLLQSLQHPRNKAEKAQKFQILRNRAMKVRSVLADPKYDPAWEAYPFNAGYFMCLRLKEIEAEPLRVHLLERYGVGLIAIGKHDLRVAFSCIDEEQIGELFDTILKGIQDLQEAA